MSAKTFSFSGALWTDRAVFYPEPQQYAKLYAAATPFLSAVMSRFQSGPKLPGPDFKMFEHRAGWRYTYLDHNDGSPPAWSAAGAPNDTLTSDITVDNATGCTVDSSLVGCQLEVWDSTLTTYKGTLLVTAVGNSTTITCKSAGNPESSTGAVAALADNDRFYVIAPAFGEETTAPEAESDELDVVWSSCQLIRTSLEIGQTLREAALRGETDELKRLRENRGNFHKMRVARAMYYANRPGGIGGVAHGAGGGTDATFVNHITDANSKTVRQMMGIWPALRRYGRRSGDQQNYFTFQKAAFTYNDWVDMWEKATQYSGGSAGMPEVYAGPGALSFFAKIGAEGFVTSTGLREPLKMSESRQSGIGLVYKIIDTPHGPARLVPDPLLRGTPYNSSMLNPDPGNARMVQYEPSQYHVNIKTDDNPRVQKDEFVDFVGLALTVMESHSAVHLN
jgi:hypothetical protein